MATDTFITVPSSSQKVDNSQVTQDAGDDVLRQRAVIKALARLVQRTWR
jgi:hypothetical protein